jgi:hypothetical protein
MSTIYKMPALIKMMTGRIRADRAESIYPIRQGNKGKNHNLYILFQKNQFFDIGKFVSDSHGVKIYPGCGGVAEIVPPVPGQLINSPGVGGVAKAADFLPEAIENGDFYPRRPGNAKTNGGCGIEGIREILV